MKTLFKGKNILVTGGTGTVGRLLVEQVLKYEPAVVRILSRDESKQFDMQKELMDVRNVRFFIGDVRDKERLIHAMDGVDFVFHTAAMKHVIACEYNPFEALKTNLEGSKNVIEAALENGVRKVILTSTDKATNPCNTMGVSKLFAERLFTAANYYKGGHATAFASVRFGNIMGSRGSVVPLFKKQIENGGPVTVTDPEMTRFVITTQQSMDFVFRATQLAQGGEIFILKMPVICVRDLLDVMIDMFGPAACGRKGKIAVRIIGAQPGEKVYEELMTEEESTRAVELPDMFVLLPQIRDLFPREYKYPKQKKPTVDRFISHDVQPMTKPEIEKMIKSIYGL
jgi:FlaA1/EpsC-like NDP-sugar epimerase